MKTQIWSKQDFTLGELFEVVVNCENNTKILNSCFTPEYTKQLLDKYDTGHFEPIDEFYLEGSKTLTAVYFNSDISDSNCLTIEELTDRNFPLDCTIERDVEDGYVYSNYDNIVFNKNYIVLC